MKRTLTTPGFYFGIVAAVASLSLFVWLAVGVPVDSLANTFATPVLFVHAALTGLALLASNKVPNVSWGFLVTTLLALVIQVLWFGIILFIR